QAIRHHQRLVHQGRVGEGDRLVVEGALEQVLHGHVADDVVDVAVAHRVVGVGFLGDAGAHVFFGVVEREVQDAVAVGHGAGQGGGFQLEDVVGDVLLGGVQGAGFRAGLGQGQDVVGGDALVPLAGQVEQPDQ